MYFVAGRSPTTSDFIVLCFCTTIFPWAVCVNGNVSSSLVLSFNASHYCEDKFCVMISVFKITGSYLFFRCLR